MIDMAQTSFSYIPWTFGIDLDSIFTGHKGDLPNLTRKYHDEDPILVFDSEDSDRSTSDRRSPTHSESSPSPSSTSLVSYRMIYRALSRALSSFPTRDTTEILKDLPGQNNPVVSMNELVKAYC
jgi:hypothetical protein